jgi:hypothetical protein
LRGSICNRSSADFLHQEEIQIWLSQDSWR